MVSYTTKVIDRSLRLKLSHVVTGSIPVMLLSNRIGRPPFRQSSEGQAPALAVRGEVVVGVVASKGEPATEEAVSINLEGKLSSGMGGVSFVVDGGGISEVSSLRFLPLGAGSKGGDLLYVTVLVITDRTLTDLEQALLGASK